MKVVIRTTRNSVIGFKSRQLADRRRDPRRNVGGTGIVAWIEEDGQGRCSQAQIKDASKLGAGLVLPIALPVGRTIWLLLESGADYRAVTRYCREGRGGFHIGIRRIPEKRGSVAGSSQSLYRMKWFDSRNNLQTTDVSVVHKRNSLTVVAGRKVPCPSIVLLATDEDMALGYCPRCCEHAPYRLNVKVFADTYVSH